MKPLIVANWKCNPVTLKEAKRLFDSIKRGIKNIKNTEVVICPPYTQFSIFNFQFSKNIKLGAQNCFWEKKGAFTGEISPTMLKDLGCQYVIIGHSERRKYLKETNEIINKKLRAVLSAKLNPILCIGETLKEKKQGKTKKVLQTQLQKAFYQIRNTKYQVPATIIAYEPVWAIGTGKACLPSEAGRIRDFIRKIISQIANRKIAKNIKILYGGSVNSKNIKSFIYEAHIDGVLVGGASLDSQEFVRIVKSVGRS